MSDERLRPSTSRELRQVGDDLMNVAEDCRLPRVDETPPNLALMVLGRALAEVYRDTIGQPLPEPLARILREIEDREGRRT
jgi:hypothetical protein